MPTTRCGNGCASSCCPPAACCWPARAPQLRGFVASAREGDGAWIEQLYLMPGWTGQGIGGQLLAAALARLPRPVRLYCFQANAGARAFYERQGFRAIAFGDGSGNEEGCPDVLYELAGPE